MRCCVPFCKNTTEICSKSQEITFHEFPTEPRHRINWLRGLGIQATPLPEGAVACSQHFLHDDMYEASGVRQIHDDAIPSTVQVCMICLNTDCKLVLMSKYKLESYYENLTGHAMLNQVNLRQTLCVECAHRLNNFNRFRDKSLRAHTLMTDLVSKHGLVSLEHIGMIDRVKHQLKSNTAKTTAKSDQYDLYIKAKDLEEDKQTESSIAAVEEDSCDTNDDGNIRLKQEIDMEHNEDNIEGCVLVKVEEVSSDNDDMTSEQMESDVTIEIERDCDTMLVNNMSDEDNDNEEFVLIKEDSSGGVMSRQSHCETKVNGVKDPLKCDMLGCSICSMQFHDEDAYNEHMERHARAGEFEFESELEIPLALRRRVLRKRSSVRITSLSTRKKALSTQDTLDSSNGQYKDTENKHSTNPTTRNNGATTDSAEPLIETFLEQSLWIPDEGAHTNSSHQPANIFNTNAVAIKLTYTGDNCYACKLCSYECDRPAKIARHVRIHTGVKPFACTLCDYKSIERGNLIRHIRIHTGEKPFACTYCNYRCVDRSTLNKHIKIHTARAKYYCTSCNYKCNDRSNFARHMKVHNGVKTLACLLCDYKCIDRSNFNRHMKLHT